MGGRGHIFQDRAKRENWKVKPLTLMLEQKNQNELGLNKLLHNARESGVL